MEQKTVAQKRGDDIRGAADKLKKVRLTLQGKNIPDTTHWNQLVVQTKNERGETVFKFNTDKFKVWIKENAQQTGKISGVSALWMLEYLTRGLNTVLVDNPIIRNMEQLAQKKAKTEFIKKRP